MTASHHPLEDLFRPLLVSAQQLRLPQSRPELAFWEEQLQTQLTALFAAGDEEVFNQLLDYCQQNDKESWGEILRQLEDASESLPCSLDGQDGQCLLLSLPMLGWSCYTVAHGELPANLRELIQQQLSALLAPQNRFLLCDQLFSPEQLPQGFCATQQYLLQLSAALQGGDTLFKVERKQLAETAQFLSDSRHVLCAVFIPAGQPLFRWQDGDKNADPEQLARALATPLARQYPGSNLRALRPQSFFSAWRHTDQAARPFSIHATVTFLQMMLEQPAARLLASIVPCQDGDQLEYRIGFQNDAQGPVIHGVLWPVFEEELEQHDTLQQIERCLRSEGVVQLRVHEHIQPGEYCDDCSAPYFPNQDGELLHTESPEDQDELPTQLH